MVEGAAGTVPASTAHGIALDQVCLDIDGASYLAEIEFWCSLTGWQSQELGLPGFHRLGVPAQLPLKMLFQQRERAAGETGAHLDIACNDREAEVERHLGLGATQVRRTQWWSTLKDPVGMEYCLTDRTPD